MDTPQPHDPIYQRVDNMVIFKQLGEKIDVDGVSDEQYFSWLDQITLEIGDKVPGAKLVEKDDARTAPPLNTAVYYDTDNYDLMETGALLRTSCNKITHAFCAFKEARGPNGIRKDHRYVFQGEEKKLIQDDPSQPAAARLVREVLQRKSEKTTGHYFFQRFPHLTADQISPVLQLDNYRYGFFVWLDREDALRCSLDRAYVTGLRHPDRKGNFSEVELAIYPRIKDDIADDPRVPQLIKALRDSLNEVFGAEVTREIKYQRAAKVLGLR